ncbi:DnaJ family domain-containing protein [Uliginosibacterium paludis]|uniref:DnaJ family domain-containing protein n=1 Tax=Uliginosibacterium paludis TaxID=1615952 RepID=A0ABV2CQQ1_9RHOO
MLLLDLLAEQRITRAMEAGAFDHLEGAGKPLPEEDLGLVPEELRAGYRVLRNAGFIPPELEMRREAVAIALQLAALGEASGAAGLPAQRAGLLDRLNRINLMLAEAGRPQLVIPLEYVHKLVGKV